MSIANQLTRIQTDRNTIRNKLVALGMANSTDNLDKLAEAIDGIVDQGAVSAEILEGTSYTIPAGYHNGSGIVKAMTDVVGEAEKYKTQAKTATPTKNQQSITPDDGYYALESVTVNSIPDAYQDVSSVTAGAADVLSGKVIVTPNGTVTAGTMANNGAVSKLVTPQTAPYTIPAGYHNGEGTVDVRSVKAILDPTKEGLTVNTGVSYFHEIVINPIPDAYQDVTGVTADAADVLWQKKIVTATGEVVAGTMKNNGAVTKTLTKAVTSYTIPAGYHNGEGVVDVVTQVKSAVPKKEELTITADDGKLLSTVWVEPIPDRYQDVTAVDAEAAHVLSGKKIVSATGAVVTGAMANNGDASASFDGLTTTSVTIPAGYTSGGTVSLTTDIEEALAAV